MPKNEAEIKEDFIRKAKKFWIHQIFAGLDVDLERGNDTIKICQAEAVGQLRPFGGCSGSAAISRMGDC